MSANAIAVRLDLETAAKLRRDHRDASAIIAEFFLAEGCKSPTARDNERGEATKPARDNERETAPTPEGEQEGEDDAAPMSRIEAIQRLSAGLAAADRRTRSAHLMAIHALGKRAACQERRMRRIRAARETAAGTEAEGARDGE